MEPKQLEDVLQIPVSAVWDPLSALWGKLLAFVPNLLAVVVILLVGYAVSAALGRVARVVLRRLGFDDASRRIGVRGLLDRAGVEAAGSEILGGLVFWLVMLTFLVSAAETLGLRNVSATIAAFVRYLPNVLGAAVILVVGLVIAHFLRDLLRGGTRSLGVEYAGALSNVVYGVLVVVIVGLAVGQLQIDTGLFDRVVEITLMATGAALALGLGFGTRDIARQLVAGVYARELFRPGMTLVVGDESGSLQDVGAVCIRLRAEDGRVIHIPNAQITERVIRTGDASA
jgi:small-conductance mechanosensitive channel